MRSRASLRGHPIHPALIPFPFAFLYGAFLFHLAGRLVERPAWWTTGSHLAVAGIVMALVAAVPGAIDYFYTVPPRSTGKQRARKHALVNLSAVGLFAVTVLLRGGGDVVPGAVDLALEALAVGLLTFGGWMGGTLVSRNQISVDHRYAGAGKWREETVTALGAREVVVGRADELEVDQLKLVHLDGRRIAVGRTADGYVAFDDRCSHRGGSLADGVMICGTVQCPWHGSQFDTASGAVRAGPAEEAIATWRVERRGDDLVLLL
jgi:nitrite reductase/ring-hydroxylating ferredoxin subunit/uncharacterized membrane protein